jgi:hypothetical protein
MVKTSVEVKIPNDTAIVPFIVQVRIMAIAKASEIFYNCIFSKLLNVATVVRRLAEPIANSPIRKRFNKILRTVPATRLSN